MNIKSRVQLFVPTRNSAGWIREFVRAYRRLAIRPAYLVDARSSDNTGAILRSEGMEVVTVTPQADRVEAVMGLIPEVCQTPWALRLDDDELPSAALLDWLDSDLAHIEEDAVALERRHCCFGRDGVMRYSRAELFYWNEDQPDMLDPQTRVFRPQRVRYVADIHTPGFVARSKTAFAPTSAYFLHLDWIVRSAAERIRKIREYETQTPGGGWNFARFYLPECFTPERLKETDFHTDEFDELSSRLLKLHVSKILNML